MGVKRAKGAEMCVCWGGRVLDVDVLFCLTWGRVWLWHAFMCTQRETLTVLDGHMYKIWHIYWDKCLSNLKPVLSAKKTPDRLGGWKAEVYYLGKASSQDWTEAVQNVSSIFIKFVCSPRLGVSSLLTVHQHWIVKRNNSSVFACSGDLKPPSP